jgi:hypothetical protein
VEPEAQSTTRRQSKARRNVGVQASACVGVQASACQNPQKIQPRFMPSLLASRLFFAYAEYFSKIPFMCLSLDRPNPKFLELSSISAEGVAYTGATTEPMPPASSVPPEVGQVECVFRHSNFRLLPDLTVYPSTAGAFPFKSGASAKNQRQRATFGQSLLFPALYPLCSSPLSLHSERKKHPPSIAIYLSFLIGKIYVTACIAIRVSYLW